MVPGVAVRSDGVTTRDRTDGSRCGVTPQASPTSVAHRRASPGWLMFSVRGHICACERCPHTQHASPLLDIQSRPRTSISVSFHKRFGVRIMSVSSCACTSVTLVRSITPYIQGGPEWDT